MARQLELVPTVKTTVRFPEELYRRLRIKAIEERRPVAALIADAVATYLSSSENEQAETVAPRRKL
jgi:predicted transcriptional regulator